MTTVTISDARTFSLQTVQKNALVSTDDLDVTLLCFEAGQRDDELTPRRGVEVDHARPVRLVQPNAGRRVVRRALRGALAPS